jgi:hypothetical protein
MLLVVLVGITILFVLALPSLTPNSKSSIVGNGFIVVKKLCIRLGDPLVDLSNVLRGSFLFEHICLPSTCEQHHFE